MTATYHEERFTDKHGIDYRRASYNVGDLEVYELQKDGSPWVSIWMGKPGHTPRYASVVHETGISQWITDRLQEGVQQ